MASILSVEQLQGLAAGSSPNTITVPTGQKIVGTDVGSFIAPQMVVNQVSASPSAGLVFTNVATWNDLMDLDIVAQKDNSRFLLFAALTIQNGNQTSFNMSFRYNNLEICRFAESWVVGRYGQSGCAFHDPGVTAGTTVNYKISLLKESSNGGTTGVVNGTNNKFMIMEIAQ